MRNFSRLSAALLLSLLVGFYSPAEAASLTSKIKKVGSDIIDTAWQNPVVTTAIAIGAPLVLYLIWPEGHRNRAAPAVAGLAAAVRGLNPPAPPPAPAGNAGQRFDAMSEQQMLDHALRLSEQEAKPFQDLNMGAGEYRFNLEVFQLFAQLKTAPERVKYLQRLLYEHDQKFMTHEELTTISEVSYGLDTAQLITLFHQLSGDCRSLLALDTDAGELDPELTPSFSFDELVHDYEFIRGLRAANAPRVDAILVLERRKRQPIEDRILLMVISYFFGPQQNDVKYNEGKAILAIENLFCDKEALALKKLTVQLSDEEVREKRLARFEKNKDEN